MNKHERVTEKIAQIEGGSPSAKQANNIKKPGYSVSIRVKIELELESTLV